MNHLDILNMALEAGLNDSVFVSIERFAKLVIAAEYEAILDTIDELYDMEANRHPMFSEGYNYAMRHILEFIEGRVEFIERRVGSE